MYKHGLKKKYVTEDLSQLCDYDFKKTDEKSIRHFQKTKSGRFMTMSKVMKEICCWFCSIPESVHRSC